MTLAIMFKESFRSLDLESLGVTAMVIFIVTFISMTVWAIVQQNQEVRRWADLPLSDDANPAKSPAQERP